MLDAVFRALDADDDRRGLDGACRFGQETFAGASNTGRDAPLPVIAVTPLRSAILLAVWPAVAAR